jgi:glycerol kinase
VPEEKETAAFGAACLAGYTIGALPSLESVKKFVKLKYTYEPKMSADEREERLTRWLEAAERSRDWARDKKS